MQKQVNSLITFKNAQGVQVRATLLKLSKKSIVFEVYNPALIVQLSEVLEDLTLEWNENLVYKGKAVVSNLVNTGLMLVVSATLVEQLKDFAEKSATPSELEEKTIDFINDWNRSHDLQPGYQVIVGELRAFLNELSRWVEQFDTAEMLVEPGDEVTYLEAEYFQAMVKPLIKRLGELFMQFEREASLIKEEELTIHKVFAQNDLHPLMLRSPFFFRSFTKPLGYAGDYEMVNMMTRSEGREGPTSYAQIINSYFYNIGPTRAHRNRIDILYNYLCDVADQAKKNNVKVSILNIGCGPALEIQKFIRDYDRPDYCDFTLVDFNQETINYTSNRLKVVAKECDKEINVEFVLQSVYTLLQQVADSKNDQNDNSFDFVYCAGLFDYLSDRVCARLLKLFYQWAKDGAFVLSTNVCPNNPSRWVMEHIIDWYLIHRGEEEMSRIAPPRGIHKLYLDETSYNVFLETKKQADANR